MAKKRLSVLIDGQRISTCFVCPDHPIASSRVGFVCRVVEAEGIRRTNAAHIYFENEMDEGPCFFYHDNRWWISYIPIRSHLNVNTDYRRQELEAKLDGLQDSLRKLIQSREHQDRKIADVESSIKKVCSELEPFGVS